MPKVKIVYAKKDDSSGSSRRAFSGGAGSRGSISGGSSGPSRATQSFAAKKSGARSRERATSKKYEDYERMRIELTNDGTLWEDPDFKADGSSLFPRGSKSFRNIEWKRPSDLCESPHLFTDGMSRFDIQQGEIGDCWFLAAVASLSMSEDLIERVVPSDQGFDKRRYCGAFFFRFWRFGEWEEVIVDDRLPTRNGKLVFMHSKENNEFWSALLEKAYAKVNGSYENLAGGSQAEAMEDFTGGLSETFDLQNSPPKNFFKTLLKCSSRKSLMGCAIEVDDMGIESHLSNGLVVGHAYSITDVKKVKVKNADVELIRIRNPWGQSEWTGAWSDDSREAKQLTAQQKADLGIVNENDGEFWMCSEDFLKFFTKLEVCHLSPEDEAEIDDQDLSIKAGPKIKKSAKRKWEECLEVGSWVKNVSAGGCRNYLGSFPSNPQFRVEVVDPDEDDDEDLGTLIIGLMQKDVRRRGLEFNTIGYAIYRLKDPKCGRLDVSFFKSNKMAGRSPQFINTREVCGRHKIAPGHYVIIPTTFQPGSEGDFLMRIFSEKPNQSSELDDNNSYTNLPDAKPSLAMSPANLRTLKETFRGFAGPSEQISAYQLRDILNSTVKNELVNFDGFNAEVCRSLVALYDVDQTGKVEFDEFIRLWGDLRTWKAIFLEHDSDNSGAFDAYEFRAALENSGFKLCNRVFEIMAMRYSDPKEGTVSFDDFLLAVIRARTAFENFSAQPQDKEGNACFSMGMFLQISLYV